jgi:hypothetical protein
VFFEKLVLLDNIIVEWNLHYPYKTTKYAKTVKRTKGASAPLASGIANVPGRKKGCSSLLFFQGYLSSRGWALKPDSNALAQVINK